MKVFKQRVGLLVISLATIASAQGVPAAAGAVPSAPSVQFGLVSQYAIYSPRTGAVTFRVVFNRAPDFFATDSFGRQADSFQYFIVGNASLPYPQNYDSIIRGEEIHSRISTIPIRNAVPTDASDPGGGGWGTIRGLEPYQLRGATLTFSAPLSVISNRRDAANITYSLQTYVFGGETDNVNGHILVLSHRQQCRKGGWAHFGFVSRRQCTRFLRDH